VEAAGNSLLRLAPELPPLAQAEHLVPTVTPAARLARNRLGVDATPADVGIERAEGDAQLGRDLPGAEVAAVPHARTLAYIDQRIKIDV
jgi:hypothetical protein